MAEKLLTDRKIAASRLTHGDERLLTDGNGLYLRIRAAGKDWLFIYSLAGKRRKMGLGPYPAVSLEKAREKAQEARASVADRQDPIAARDTADAAQRAQEAAAASRHTLRTLFELWHRKEAAPARKDGGAEIRRAFEKDLLPTIGDLYADQIGRRHVMEALDTVKDRGVTRYANQLLQYLRQMFQFAAVREIVNGDPTFGIKRKDVGGAEVERTRTLSEAEVRELAAKLPDAALPAPTETAVWLILATCCRVGELTRAQWSHVDLEAGHWEIPAENAKNGRAHTVQLSTFAAQQFKRLQTLGASETWLFPNSDDSNHLDTKALQKQFRDRQRTQAWKGRTTKVGALALSGGEWTAHDLRRTGATLMGELGVRPDVIDRCLNHIDGDKLKRTYQRQELLADRTEAFRLLGERLVLLSRGEKAKVVTARFGRGWRAA